LVTILSKYLISVPFILAVVMFWSVCSGIRLEIFIWRLRDEPGLNLQIMTVFKGETLHSCRHHSTCVCTVDQLQRAQKRGLEAVLNRTSTVHVYVPCSLEFFVQSWWLFRPALIAGFGYVKQLGEARPSQGSPHHIICQLVKFKHLGGKALFVRVSLLPENTSLNERTKALSQDGFLSIQSPAYMY